MVVSVGVPVNKVIVNVSSEDGVWLCVMCCMQWVMSASIVA